MSTITLRLFSILLLLIVTMFSAIYFFSVPLIKNSVFKIELNSNKQVLNVAFNVLLKGLYNSDVCKHNHKYCTDSRESSNYKVEIEKLKNFIEIYKSIKNLNGSCVYVFDSNGDVLFDSSDKMIRHNIKVRLNSTTEKSLYEELISTADKNKEFYYKWDRPDDLGHYVYEKLAITRHLPKSNLYISTSVYLDDLRANSIQLSQRIFVIGMISLFVGMLIVFLFAKWLTAPICKLSSTAQRINKGDLTAKTNIQRNDELGMLAESFDLMVERLRNNINTLNLRVEARTSDLSESNTQLLNTVKRLKTTQAELHAVEARQRLILDSLPAQVAYLDSDQRFIFANREFLEFFNVTKDSVIGKPMNNVVDPIVYGFIRYYIQRALKGEKIVYEYTLKDNHQDVLTRRTLLPFYDDSNNVIGVLSVCIDITKERETEKRLAEASKMKAVGQLSGGMAHDFNNLLTIILGNLLELQNQKELPAAWNNNLIPAIRATRRGGDMTRRLLAFSRRQPLSSSYIAPQLLISEIVDLLSAPLPDNIVFFTDVVADCPIIFVDSGLMEDALVNLILNSADAMPKGGQLSLQVKSVGYLTSVYEGQFDEPISAGQYVLFSIIDSGRGFSSEALTRAYEPFFTTKSSEAGSGLGLSMVFGFVKQSKGYMRIQNNPDIGAKVEMLIPVAQDSPLIFSDTLPVTGVVSKDRKDALVLLVEDNEDVRLVVRQQLLSLGYSVIESSSADNALLLLEANLSALVGVISDAVMPGNASYYDISLMIKENYKGVFFVLMSGYSDQLVQLEYEGVLLQKPFDISALSDAIASNQIKVPGHSDE
ncbi:PAS domain-containing protein [Marinomonas sp. TI.3.20]|uniref:PAS domain-containing protein n=1 Tax=Marinomonas sp. TI.3.20 TaxID=3121296 RepID=UPI00311D6C52